VSIGARIVMLREQKGLTQYELAEKAHISKSVMNRIELGTRPIRDDELISFAKILGVTADFLLGLTSSDIKENLTPNTKIIFKEELLIKKYRQLNDDDKEYINDFIDLRLAKQAKEKII
jgi:transcriptional regulator with XRE-family HTH domain